MSQFLYGAVQLWMTQVVPEHAGVPLSTAHTLPHWPHAATLFVVEVSQPFPTLPSQLPQPEAHVMPHAPAEHEGVPFCELHTLPHAPQFDTFVAVFISQPLLCTLSQFAKVPVQLTSWQVPVAQVSVALARLHPMPHAPQSVSVVRLVSQPSEYWPLQFW